MKKEIKVIQVKSSPCEQLSMVAYPDNNRILVSVFLEYDMYILDRFGEKQKKDDYSSFYSHLLGASQMKVTPNGRYLITGGQSCYEEDKYNDSTIKIWEISTWKLIRQLPGHAWTVNGLDISADLRYLISSSGKLDYTLRLWDLNAGNAEILGQTDFGFRGCAISPDGAHYACSEGIFDRKTKKKIYDFSKYNCEFFQYSSNGDFLLCGDEEEKGFYIVWLTSPEINVQEFSPPIEKNKHKRRVWHGLFRISPNNRYIVYASGNSMYNLVIVEVHSGEIVESLNRGDHPEIRQSIDSYSLSKWETMALSQDGRIYLGYSNQVFVITPDVDLSINPNEGDTLIPDPEIINPNQDHEVAIYGTMYDTKKYLQIYDKYHLPSEELQGLLGYALNYPCNRALKENLDLVEEKMAFISNNHISGINFYPLDYEGEPTFPTQREFPFIEIILGYYDQIPHIHKHLRILDLRDRTKLTPISIDILAQMPQLEVIGNLKPEFYPPEFCNRVYTGAIISSLEVEALQEWERILHQEHIWHPRNIPKIIEISFPKEKYLFDGEYSYFISSKRHVKHIFLRWNEDVLLDVDDVSESGNIFNGIRFPPSMQNLKWLTHVELPDLCLEHFPSEIQSWSMLQELHIHVNCTSIPPWLANISTLQKLVVRGNSIIEIPLQLPTFIHQNEISWHPAYAPYYEGKTLSEIARLGNPSHDKKFHPTNPTIPLLEKNVSGNDQIDSFKFLDLRFSDLTSLNSLELYQEEIGLATHVYLRHNQILNLNAFPSVGKNLAVLDLGYNRLQNLVGLPSNLSSKCIILLDGNPLRSLCGLSRTLITRTILLNFWGGKKLQKYFLHPRILLLLSQGMAFHAHMSDYYLGHSISESKYEEDYFDEGLLEEIIAYYEETPQMLVNTVIRNLTSISEKICERLCHEGGFKERQMLEPHLPPNHPILVAIDKRLQIDTPNGYSIQL